MEETRKHKKWRQDKQPDQVSFIECRVMPYIGWQGKRLGQGGDRGRIFSNYNRACAVGLYFSRARDRTCALGCISSWAGKCLRARGKGWRARERLARGNSFGARGRNLGARGRNLGAHGKSFGCAREGFVNKELGNVPSCLRFAEIKQQRSANSGPHGSGQVPLFYI